MIYCRKCNGRMMVDREYSSDAHMEIFCIRCGSRRFFHPPSESKEGTWLLQREKLRAKSIITSL
jgi:DNA-directed RNA polymerase subunit RPC12/RpoP